MSFDFANPGLSPSAWHIDFDSEGLGHYHSEPGSTASPGPQSSAQGALTERFDHELRVSATLRQELFATAHARKLFTTPCENPRQKVAFTGHKTVIYSGPDGQGSCTFNWSPDMRLTRLANSFLGISLTLEEGRKLHSEYLHDRLSLDGELEILMNAVKNGTAIELENIAPELEAIAEDGAVMKRAQARATALLSLVPPDVPNGAAYQAR